MTRLEQLEKLAYRVALLLTLAAAARFGWSLTQVTSRRVAAASEAPNTSEHVHQSGLALPGAAFPGLPTSSAPLGMPSPEAMKAAIAAAVGSSVTAPAPIIGTAKPPRDIVHSFLSVQSGAPRSELRINGELVGRTPFLGQISCERGQTVRVDLLPPKGLPNHYEIPCLEGEMRLRDEP